MTQDQQICWSSVCKKPPEISVSIEIEISSHKLAKALNHFLNSSCFPNIWKNSIFPLWCNTWNSAYTITSKHIAFQVAHLTWSQTFHNQVSLHHTSETDQDCLPKFGTCTSLCWNCDTAAFQKNTNYHPLQPLSSPQTYYWWLFKSSYETIHSP